MNTHAAFDAGSTMITTPWREFTEVGSKYRIRATYGWRKIGEQEPYWSVTGETEVARDGYWREDSCGCIHDKVTKYFTNLLPAIKWHLCNLTSGPMHYVANSVYWYEKHLGMSKYPDKDDHKNALRHFKSTVVFGTDEELPVPQYSLVESNGTIRTTLSAVSIESWCVARLPALLEAMKQETDAALALSL